MSNTATETQTQAPVSAKKQSIRYDWMSDLEFCKVAIETAQGIGGMTARRFTEALTTKGRAMGKLDATTIYPDTAWRQRYNRLTSKGVQLPAFTGEHSPIDIEALNALLAPVIKEKNLKLHQVKSKDAATHETDENPDENMDAPDESAVS